MIRRTFSVPGAGTYVLVFERDGGLLADLNFFDGDRSLEAVEAMHKELGNAIEFMKAMAMKDGVVSRKVISSPNPTEIGKMQTTRDCRACDGSGRIRAGVVSSVKCPACSGTGRIAVIR